MIKKFRETLKKAKPIIITAVPVHGKHAKNTKTTTKPKNLKEDVKPISRFLAGKKSYSDDNHKALKERMAKHYEDGANHNNVDSVTSYTISSHALNKYLVARADPEKKEDKSDFYEGKAKRLDKYLKDAKPLPEDVSVYHGLSGWHPGMESHKHPDRHIQLPAYTSTSLNKNQAADFSGSGHVTGPNKARNYDKQHMLHIHLPKGSSHGAYVDHLSFNPGEDEFIMKRGTKLRIERKPDIYRTQDFKKKGTIKYDDHGIEHRVDEGAKHMYVWHAHPVED